MLPTLLAFMFAQASAPVSVRPQVRVSFALEAPRFAGYVDTRAAQLCIEKNLLPLTALQPASTPELAAFELNVTLEEPASSELVDSYLVFRLIEVEGRFVRQPPASTEGVPFAYRLLFRDGRTDAGKKIALADPQAVPPIPGLQSEIESRIRELAANPAQLEQMLLCYVPIRRTDAESLHCNVFFDAEDGEHELRLPFTREEIGLDTGSVFLLLTNAGRERFHLVRSEPFRKSQPSEGLPAYLVDGVVTMDCVAGRRKSEFEKMLALSKAREASESRPDSPPMAKFEQRLPLEDLKPISVHKSDPDAPHLIETLAVFIAHGEPMEVPSRASRID
jgi:hypothetical protein